MDGGACRGLKKVTGLSDSCCGGLGLTGRRLQGACHGGYATATGSEDGADSVGGVAGADQCGEGEGDGGDDGEVERGRLRLLFEGSVGMYADVL